MSLLKHLDFLGYSNVLYLYYGLIFFKMSKSNKVPLCNVICMMFHLLEPFYNTLFEVNVNYFLIEAYFFTDIKSFMQINQYYTDQKRSVNISHCKSIPFHTFTIVFSHLSKHSIVYSVMCVKYMGHSFVMTLRSNECTCVNNTVNFVLYILLIFLNNGF